MTPPSLRPLPPPLPRMLHRGERGPAAHGSLGDPALSPAPAGARAWELWPGVYLLSSLTETTSPPSREEKKEMLKLCSW